MKNFILVAIMLGIFTFSLIGCGSEKATADDLPVGFTKVSETYINKSWIYEVKHKGTGCRYLIYRASVNGNITQMYINEGGKSVPYCKKPAKLQIAPEKIEDFK